ncbi:hypothetical protein CCP4SC76_7870007 [Gammaproteobacteria bacterium]
MIVTPKRSMNMTQLLDFRTKFMNTIKMICKIPQATQYRYYNQDLGQCVSVCRPLLGSTSPKQLDNGARVCPLLRCLPLWHEQFCLK